jgi:hypothetical protein
MSVDSRTPKKGIFLMRISPFVLFSAATLAAVVACASTQEAAAPPASPEAPAAPAPADVPAPESWDLAITKDQKAAFMKAKVVPAMAPIFQASDPKAYADFGCKTCHGPEYKLPVQYLPELTLKGGQLTAFAEDPEVSKFMAEEVVPNMAKLLGKPAYNPETHEGFGCMGCHGVDKQD